jgi:hypothetical protein
MKLYHEMPKDFEIVEGAEEWSNGFYVSTFNALGLRWKIMRSNGKGDDGFYTYLRLDDYRPCDRPPTPAWLEGYHIATLPGTFEPDMAAIFLQQVAHQWERGEAAGRRNQQQDFRKAIGLDK